MNRNRGRRLALRAGAAPLVLIAATLGFPAFAQDAPQESTSTSQNVGISAVPTGSGEPNQSLDENQGTIVVTGSRIARRDLTSDSPLAVVSQEEFKLSGAVNVESVLNTLPQVIPGSTGFSNNPGGGVATLNLRGLGSNRNLVLVNGRRYMFYDTSQVVDLNTIPAFLIDGVDVVTGGASAVYGSDAIAGVVNFRLRNDINGVEAGSQYSITEEGDGQRWDTYLAMGTDFDEGRGHITAYGEYYQRKAIFQGARDFSAVALGDSGTSLVPLGSSSVPNGRFYVNPSTVCVGSEDPNCVGGTSFTRGAGSLSANSTLGQYYTGPNTSRPFTTNDYYNYAPDNYLQVPQERWMLGAYANYEVNDWFNPYMELSFVNNRVANELAASPISGTFNIAVDNPFLSAADAASLAAIDAQEAAIDAALIAAGGAGRYNNPGVVGVGLASRTNAVSSRQALDERNAFRVLIGSTGAITSGIKYDAYYSYARTRNSNIQYGNISRSAFAAELLANRLNIFGPNLLSAEEVAAISITTQNTDISELQVAQASISGSLFDFGLGGGSVGFALGGEYRSVESQFIPDQALSSGDVVGFNGGDPTAGGYNVKEVFGELSVPLLGGLPFAEKLELNGAFRYSDYSLGGVGGVWTYTGGAQWAPVRDITFRAQYSRAVRAPNVSELFGGQSNGFPGATDPCATAGAQNDAALVAICTATGVPASAIGSGASLQPNPQIEGLFGGNPDLQEEVTDTYTAGVVLAPSFLPGLHVTADYFNIKVDNVITSLGGGVGGILNLCYNVFQDVNSIYCQAISRNDDGTIQNPTFVTAVNANAASLKTSGVDLSVDYTQTLGFGMFGAESKLNAFFQGTWTEKYEFAPVAGQQAYTCAGYFGVNYCSDPQGNPQSKYKWTSRLSLIDGPVTASLRWRHLSSVKADSLVNGDPVSASELAVPKLKAKDYLDLAFSIDLTDTYNFSFGVNNIGNVKPQLIGSDQQQANTYPGVYDVLGRDFYAAVRFRF
ncbi:TonB-dependent receptor domain-containing protein [Sphingomonas molluscorum]|uniref:TonB-dependent receptor domain-containing protein n=1 Tax=Sphingomonas TaxID=13687 RepID=UPI001047CA44